MSELDSKKRTRSKTKNDDSLNKPQPKKSRGKAIKKEIKDENPPESNAPSKIKNDDSLNKPQPKKRRGKAIKKEIKDENPPESNAPSSLENNNEVEGDSSQAQSSKKWTPEQRLQLIEAVLKHVKVPWDEVSNEVDGGKNGKMCYDQWRRKIVPGLKTYIKSEHEHYEARE